MDFSPRPPSRTKRHMQKRARRLGALDLSKTATRCSSDARSTPTREKGMPSLSSAVTRGAWNGRSFGPLTSFASYRTDAGSVARPRYWMSSRCLRETHNEEHSAASAERRAAKDIFAKQSHFMGGANKELVADTVS
jgi:hypothetical protein